MEVCPVHDVIKNLTEWEKMFIKRAHTFRSIFSARNASSKKIPANQRHRIGKCFGLHLPLSLKQTLKSVLEDKDVLNTGDLNVYLTSNFSKQPYLWKDVVDFEKIYNALKVFKFKMNNYLYKDINLPDNYMDFAKSYDNILEVGG